MLHDQHATRQTLPGIAWQLAAIGAAATLTVHGRPFEGMETTTTITTDATMARVAWAWARELEREREPEAGRERISASCQHGMAPRAPASINGRRPVLLSVVCGHAMDGKEGPRYEWRNLRRNNLAATAAAPLGWARACARVGQRSARTCLRVAKFKSAPPPRALCHR